MSPLVPTSSSGGGASSRDQLMAVDMGMITEAFDIGVAASSGIPGGGTITCSLVHLLAGDPITNILTYVGAAASGTAPTLVKCAVLGSDGSRKAVSADQSASAIWKAIGFAVCPLTAVYTVPSDGAYYFAYLRVGNYGTANENLLAIASPGFSLNALGSSPPRKAQLTGQADIGAANAIVAFAGNHFWFGAS